MRGVEIEAIVFDKDGTLFDFTATWGPCTAAVISRVAELTGVGMSILENAFGYSLAQGKFRPDSVAIAGSTQDVIDVVAPHIPREVDLLGIMENFAARTRPVAVPGLEQALTTLGQRRVLGVATNDSEGPARAHLDAHAITHHFDFIAGYDSGFGAKPAPGQLLGFCGATGVRAEATAMVGDSRHDLAAGRAAGMTTIGVLTGVAKSDELADLADVVLDDIRGIEEWLGSA